MKKLFFISILLVASFMAYSQILKTPLMGWATWNTYEIRISETIIKQQADAMVISGLKAAGYNFINIDDGFFDGRYPNGALKIDATKFPNGMKNVADYIHSKGLKAGFYSEGGSNTCGSLTPGFGQIGGIGVGLYQHDQQDLDTIITKWGYDFLKVDWCGGVRQGLDEQTRYTAIRNALNKTGRTDINYNVCRWQFPGSWVTKVADSWRISGDIANNWSSVTGIIDQNAFLAPYCSQSHYNDMDMMNVGRGLTYDEDKSHFSMWCILSSPLVLGNDLTNISSNTLSILTNKEVIDLNQDTTGLQAKILSDDGSGLQVWAKPLNGKLSRERAVVLFNRSAVPASMSVKWTDLNIVGSATVRDLWLHVDLGRLDSMYTTTVPSHGVVVLKVVGTQTKLQEVFEAEYGWINNFNLTLNSALIANQGSVTVNATCSGRAKVTTLGNSSSNYLEFRDVYANFAGSYNLTLTYTCDVNRNAVFSINGKDTTLTNLNSRTYSSLKNVTFPVQLNAGYNIIRISNSSALLPDIDKIKLDLNKYALISSTNKVVYNENIENVKVWSTGNKLNIDSPELFTANVYNITGQKINSTPLNVTGKTSINVSDNKFVLVKLTSTNGVSKIIKVQMN